MPRLIRFPRWLPGCDLAAGPALLSRRQAPSSGARPPARRGNVPAAADAFESFRTAAFN